MEMKPDPWIRARPRPARVAYVLEEGADSGNWLDAIFAVSQGRYGGRQSLIVPAAQETISRPYQRWLKALDPDFVWMLTYDNPGFLSTISKLTPNAAIRFYTRQRGVLEEHPRVGGADDPLSAISWLPFLKLRSGTFFQRPESILDKYPAWEDDGFVQDNFGTLSASLNYFAALRDLQDYVRPLMLTPPDAPDNRWHTPTLGMPEATNAYDLLDQMGSRTGMVTVAHLSNLGIETPTVQHAWNRSFCVVVGDSFLDRLSAWNAGLLYSNVSSQPYSTLRVPMAVALDARRLRQIVTFVARSNYIGQNNSPSRVTVRTSTLNDAQLAAVVEEVGARGNVGVAGERVRSADDCCPGIDSQIFLSPTFGSRTFPTRIDDRPATVSAPMPEHLELMGAAPPIFIRGSWYVDLDIDRISDNSRFSNVRDVWRLPPSTAIPRLFIIGHHVRPVAHATFSVRVSTLTRNIVIRQPTDRDVLWTRMHSVEEFPQNDLRSGEPRLPAFRYSQPSDKGRYLTGTIGLFGSLNSAEYIFEKHFWRAQFMRLAAPSSDQEPALAAKLRKRLRGRLNPVTIGTDAEWQNLAAKVIQLSADLRLPRLTVNYKSLHDAASAELEAAIIAFPEYLVRRDELVQELPRSLKSTLAELSDCHALHRGYEWVCPECSHRNWLSIDALSNTVPCEICRTMHRLPIDLTLQFRLNEFLSACLREHDTLAVLGALCAMRRDNEQGFVFAPQTEFYRDYPERQQARRDMEVDLVCLAGGKFVVGEIKTTADRIKASDIRDLAEAAAHLRADVAILGALGGTREVLEGKRVELAALLPDGVEAKIWLSDWTNAASFSF